MTLLEVCEDLRRRGMGMTQRTVAEGIASGFLPFGKMITVGKTGRRTFFILRKDYEAWIENNMQTIPTAPPPPIAQKPKPAPDLHPGWKLVTTHTFTEESDGMMWEISIKGWKRQR